MDEDTWLEDRAFPWLADGSMEDHTVDPWPEDDHDDDDEDWDEFKDDDEEDA